MDYKGYMLGLYRDNGKEHGNDYHGGGSPPILQVVTKTLQITELTATLTQTGTQNEFEQLEAGLAYPEDGYCCFRHRLYHHCCHYYCCQ